MQLTGIGEKNNKTNKIMWIIGPIIALTILAFRFILPYRLPDKYKELNFQQFPEFSKVYFCSLLIFIGAIVSLTLLFFKIFTIANEFYSINNDVFFEIKPDNDFWILVSILLGLGFGFILLNLILRLWLKDSLGKFWVYYNKKYGFNAFLLVKLLTVTFIFVGLVLAYQGKKSYLRFEADKITIRKIFSTTEKEFKYSDIHALSFFHKSQAMNGDIVDKPHYKITFKDKFSWSTIEEMRQAKDSDKVIFDFISEKTNIEISTIEVDE